MWAARGRGRAQPQCLNHLYLFSYSLDVGTGCHLYLEFLMVMTMKSISSSAAVAVSRELRSSSSSYHPCNRPNKYNIPGASGVTTIPKSHLLWFKNTNHRSTSFSSLAISSDQAVSAAAATASDPELTWQILVAQKKCELCQGSGLVLMDNKDYFRCPDCGGFLPWLSWKRFLSG